MRKIFLTFADSRMTRALLRIHKQALAMNIYDQIIIANEFSLDIRFRHKYKTDLVQGSRGFGYWIWKPQLILQTLNQMDDGDILQYTDAGCHLNTKGRQRLIEYFSMVEKSKSGLLGFQAYPPAFHNKSIKLPDLSEYIWCKGDLADYFSVRHRKDIMNSQTIGAGIIFIRKCKNSVDLIEQWLKVYRNDMHLIDDSPSASENFEGFVEHRHDQSIFSILGKINNIDTVSAYEYWYPNSFVHLLPNWRVLRNYPIHAKRDKGVHWLLKPYYFTLRVLNRIRLELMKKSKQRGAPHERN